MVQQLVLNQQCAFCARIEGGEAALYTRDVVAFADAFPVSPGHTLVVPRQHQENFFALRASTQAEIWRVVTRVQQQLEAELAPDGFNVGVNVGAAAGQTVPHAHVHVIPRFAGDAADPRGGVRWIIPNKAAYWDA